MTNNSQRIVVSYSNKRGEFKVGGPINTFSKHREFTSISAMKKWIKVHHPAKILGVQFDPFDEMTEEQIQAAAKKWERWLEAVN